MYAHSDTTFLLTCPITREPRPFFSKTVQQLTPPQRILTIIYIVLFWWQNNKQGILASIFARSEPMQFLLVGYVKEQSVQQ
jgi:hypothetical protein